MFRKLWFLVACCLSVALISSAAQAELIGYWPLDGDATDASGNGYDGEASPGVTYGEGQLGQAADFDAASYIDCGDVPIGTSITVACWVQPRDISQNWSGIVSKHNEEFTQKTFWFGQSNTDGALRFGYFPDSPTAATNVDSGQIILANEQWTHLACTQDGNVQRIYANGVEIVVSAERNNGIVDRGGVLRIGRVNTTAAAANFWFNGLIDDVQIYDEALPEAEIQALMSGLTLNLASSPVPDNQESDVLRDGVVLEWTAGAFAASHDVYLGKDFESVDTATTDSPEFLINQPETVYPLDRLELGATYYWRIDEVNSPPDSTVYQGETWSFTVEPVSYALPIGAVSATASSMTDPQDPNNTVNGSGLDPNTGEHSSLIGDMWISAMDDAEPSIQFEFEELQKLDKVLVWNHNSQSEALLGFGTREALISYSVDGETWSELGIVEIAQAPGMGGYTGVEVPLEGIVAKVVKLTCLSNWSALPSITQKGLSEVRFFAVPVYAREPQPEDGATTDGADITLQWRAGREAVSHEVLLSDDPNAVEDGSAVVGSTEESTLQTGPLSYDTTYFWQIVEVNEAAVPAAYPGEVWQFTTPPVGVIDDMEIYKATEGLHIWEHWIDGFDNPDENGSVVGNGDDAEKTIVHSGSQSLPLAYNNNTAPKSEATRTFDAPMDLTASEVQGLVLYFHGDAGNTGGSLYVKINDVQIAYDSDADNLQRAGWSKWFIPLADVTGTDLTEVSSLTIGVDSGGQGVIYVDDIVVTPAVRELITPVDPGTDGLVAHYAFEGNAADSTGQHPGTIMGFALFEQGAVGQAISLAGLADNYVEITGYKGIVADADGVQPAFSVACWFNTSENGDMVTWGSATGTPVGGQYMTFRIEAGNLRTEHGDGNIRGNTPCNDGEWHHGALTVVEGASLRVPQTMLYIDGQADGINSGSDNVCNVTADADVNIGQRASHADRWFPGLLDEVMIYDRVLSAGEVAALAGRTLPFDKP